MEKVSDIIGNESFAYEQLTDNSWVLIYAQSKILLEKLGSISQEAKDVPCKEIKELRIFNGNAELKAWNYQGDLKFRYIVGNTVHLQESQDPVTYEEIYPQTMLLWGNRVENKSILVESGYGTRITFPIDISKYKLPLKIETKSYYNYDDNGLICFQDARLVKITDNSGTEVK